MKVKITHLGTANRPEEGLDRWYYIYFLQAENGQVAMTEDEDLIPNGTYELPDEDWVYDKNKDYGEDLIREQDLLGCSFA